MQQQPTIALLHWGDLIEDFLDTIGVSFESFCQEMTGGWMFGYIEALKLSGVKTVLFCVSAQVKPARYTHQPTGALICVLPASKLHGWVRRSMQNDDDRAIEATFGKAAKLRRLRYSGLKDIAPYLATPLTLLGRALRQEGCQAILCQEYEYARFDACVWLAHWLRLPVFATFQGGDFQTSRIERPLRPLALHACKGLIIATQTEIQRVQTHYRVPAHKIAQIFNPMDAANWTAFDRNTARRAIGIPVAAQVVVYHGRIELHRKGLDLLMQAWRQVCEQCPDRDLRLLMVGTGSDAAQLHQIIADQQIRGVFWRDEYVRDRDLIRQYLSVANCYVLPSRHEGFPVAPIEAMACGLPIVAADAPGIADILEAGEASGGIIVPRENPTALATALKRLLSNETLQQQMGQQARQRTEQAFSLEVIGNQLKDFMCHS